MSSGKGGRVLVHKEVQGWGVEYEPPNGRSGLYLHWSTYRAEAMREAEKCAKRYEARLYVEQEIKQ